MCFVCMYLYKYMYMYIHTHMYKRVYVCVCVCRVHVWSVSVTCLCVCVCVCVFVCNHFSNTVMEQYIFHKPVTNAVFNKIGVTLSMLNNNRYFARMQSIDGRIIGKKYFNCPRRYLSRP